MYRLYIDEVGTDAITNLSDDKHRYLSLTGVAMKVDHARDHLEPRLNWIKANVFEHDPDDPLILHRKEIMGLKGPFGALREPQKRRTFNTAIMRVFKTTDYTIITALIDKAWMLKQSHWTQTHPYHYLMEILVEKYVQFLERVDDIGDLMPESRQGKDTLLQNAYTEVRQRGSSFVDTKRITSAIRADNLKFRKKRANSAGLQLCDLLAHPSHIYTRTLMKHPVSLGPFATQIAGILVSDKYDRSRMGGKILGYGIKFLPQ